ncbi:MAG: alpha/beta fold hydrolase [Gemmatimonadota bacterium]
MGDAQASAPPEAANGAERSDGRAPAWFRWATRTLSRAAPSLATMAAERFFVRPPSRALKAAEADWAAAARTLTIDTSHGPVRTWRWPAGPESVLLVHGWGGRGPQLGAVARALVDRGYTAIAWDMPGHGEQTRPTNLLEMARVTAEIAPRFEPPAGVVAHSFGMATTLVAGSRHGLRPARLVGVAPAAILDSVTAQFADMTGFTEDVVERMRGRLSRRIGFEWRKLEAATIAPGVSCPALLIHDHEDERVPFADGEELARLLPRADLVTTRGLGHSGPLRDPGTIERIADFFGRSTA